MYIKRFFDPSPNEGGGFKIGEPIEIGEVFESLRNIEPEEETVDDPPAEPAPKGPDEAQPPVENKTPETVVTPEPTTPAEPASPVVDWKETLKQNREEGLRELGIDTETLAMVEKIAKDDYVKKLIQHREQNGDLSGFLKETTTDWTKVSHLDVLRDDLRRQHPTMDDAKFEILAKAKIDKLYIPDALASDDDRAVMEIDLEVAAERIRQTRIAEQKNFLDNVKPVDVQTQIAEAQRLQEQQQAQQLQEYSNYVDKLPSVSNLLKEKKVVFGEGTGFKYAVSAPEKVIDVAKNPNKFFELFGTGDNVNWDHFIRTIAFAMDPSGVSNGMISHGKSSGKEEAIEPIVNAKTEGSVPKTKSEGSLGRAFVERGQPFTF